MGFQKEMNTFMNTFHAQLKEIFGGASPNLGARRFDLLNFVGNLWADQGGFDRQGSGTFAFPGTLVNPMGQGYEYTINITLDAGVLTRVGYQRLKIQNQETGHTTAQSVLGSTPFVGPDEFNAEDLGHSPYAHGTPPFGLRP